MRSAPKSAAGQLIRDRGHAGQPHYTFRDMLSRTLYGARADQTGAIAAQHTHCGQSAVTVGRGASQR